MHVCEKTAASVVTQKRRDVFGEGGLGLLNPPSKGEKDMLPTVVLAEI